MVNILKKKPNLPRGGDGKPRVSEYKRQPGCLGGWHGFIFGFLANGGEKARDH
jgi:hypothetical protein